MWIRWKKKMWFQKAKFAESNKELDNPDCGWYHIYPFIIQTPAEFSPEETQVCISDISKKEHLVLVRIDIGAFRSCDIPEDALETISRIFELFRVNQKRMIVRFTYDSEGKGMEREPRHIELVKRHMEQLGEIVCEFASDILVLQGIFVGSWGEMHHSKFLAESDMYELICSLYQATRGSCYLAVRTPEQWRRITEHTKADLALKKKLGLFNDGLFGSSTDLGTYREAAREEELNWQECFAVVAPNGGETVAGKSLTGYRQASDEMKRMHLSYLNSSYQPEQLEYWKKEWINQSGCWNGLSGYEYIGRHLGSRFVVCDVNVLAERLVISIENRGFSGVYEETECFLVVEAKEGKKVWQSVDTSESLWKCEKEIVLQISLSDEAMEAAEGKIFFQMRRKRDGKIIRFANQGADDKILLGRFGRR